MEKLKGAKGVEPIQVKYVKDIIPHGSADIIRVDRPRPGFSPNSTTPNTGSLSEMLTLLSN
jgi:hypothetical protein